MSTTDAPVQPMLDLDGGPDTSRATALVEALALVRIATVDLLFAVDSLTRAHQTISASKTLGLLESQELVLAAKNILTIITALETPDQHLTEQVATGDLDDAISAVVVSSLQDRINNLKGTPS